MKLAKYILGLALVAGSFALTSCDQENEGAIYEPTVQNIMFMTPAQSTTTAESSITIPVAISRAMTNGSYTANIEMAAGASQGMKLKSQQVTFADGEGMAYAYVEVADMAKGTTYTCTLNLSDADKATKNTEFGEQLASTEVSVLCDYNWVDAGTALVTDLTWYEDPVTGEVPVINAEGTNIYHLVAPLYYLYDGLEDGPDTSDFQFYLNPDGSITIDEGTNLNWWGYKGYYDSVNYGAYCFIDQDGNTYDVNFLLLNGTSLYTGGEFMFTWSK